MAYGLKASSCDPLKCELIRFFQLVFCFLCKFGIGGACAVCNYDLLHAFPDYHAYTIPQTQFAIRGQPEKSDSATKIIVTLLFNDGFEKRKIPIEGIYTLFIIFFVSK